MSIEPALGIDLSESDTYRNAFQTTAVNTSPAAAETNHLLRQLFDLNTVHEIACSFNAVLDTNALLDGIIMTAISQLGVGAAAVVIQDPGESDQLAHSRWKGWPDACDEDFTVDQASQFAAILRDTRRPLRVAEMLSQLHSGSRYAKMLQRLDCALVAPLRGRDFLSGVLFTTGKLSGHPFSDADLQFLELLVEQLSIAIENSVLYESERRYAQDLIQARDRLAQSEKMATLGRLSVAIAHEINNPLGIIKNYLHLIRKSLPEQSDGHEALDAVASEVDRVARIVCQLLDAFRPDTCRPAAVDVGVVLESVIDFLRPDLGENHITITGGDFGDLPFVVGREDPLRQVFINLALNARDAMPNGGTLTISAEVRPNEVVVQFSDQGEGLDDDTIRQVFDPFFSTKESGQGTGLGLSISRSILEGFGGTISAANAPASQPGAVFRVALKRVDSLREPLHNGCLQSVKGKES